MLKKIFKLFFDMLDKIFLTVYKPFSERLDRNSDSFTGLPLLAIPASLGYLWGILTKSATWPDSFPENISQHFFTISINLTVQSLAATEDSNKLTGL